MTAYTVEMRRTPGLGDAERRRRLAQCYRFILSLPGRTAADLDTVGSQDQDGGGDPAPSQEREHRGDYTP